MALPAVSAVAAACGYLPDRVDLDRVEIDPDGRTMRVVFQECEADLELELDETPTSVAFTASATRGSDTFCEDVRTIGIREPLGDRTVTFNGQEIVGSSDVVERYRPPRRVRHGA